jgi:anion-transporting  ArsA/GET3 family ATPase
VAATLPLPRLEDKRLIVVLGKGGVGRTTMAVALAAHLAARGKKTLFYQANAKERLATLLGGPPATEEIRPIRENLWAVNTNPQAALHEYGLMVLRYEAVYKMVLENRVSRALVRAIPGLDDYSVLGKLWYHTTEEERGRPRFDCIVFDGPATGHAVTFLRIPHAILEAVPEGPLTRDAAKVRALLEDPARTVPLIVTLAEEMPTNESIELAGRLGREIGLHAKGLIINQVYPAHFPAGGVPARVLDAVLADGGTDDPALAAVLQRARMSRSRRALNERYLERLARELPLPTTQVPMLFSAHMGPHEIEQIAATLARALGASPAGERRVG